VLPPREPDLGPRQASQAPLDAAKIPGPPDQAHARYACCKFSTSPEGIALSLDFNCRISYDFPSPCFVCGMHTDANGVSSLLRLWPFHFVSAPLGELRAPCTVVTRPPINCCSSILVVSHSQFSLESVIQQSVVILRAFGSPNPLLIVPIVPTASNSLH
jgi:hypothetical protein